MSRKQITKEEWEILLLYPWTLLINRKVNIRIPKEKQNNKLINDCNFYYNNQSGIIHKFRCKWGVLTAIKFRWLQNKVEWQINEDIMC